MHKSPSKLPRSCPTCWDVTIIEPHTVNKLGPKHACVSRAPRLNSDSNSQALIIYRANCIYNLIFHSTLFPGQFQYNNVHYVSV
jgi:hypothetical protein